MEVTNLTTETAHQYKVCNNELDQIIKCFEKVLLAMQTILLAMQTNILMYQINTCTMYMYKFIYQLFCPESKNVHILKSFEKYLILLAMHTNIFMYQINICTMYMFFLSIVLSRVQKCTYFEN